MARYILATDATVLSLAGSPQTITKAVTYTVAPVVPDASFPLAAVTTLVAALDARPQKAATETVSGTWTFSAAPRMSGVSGVATGSVLFAGASPYPVSAGGLTWLEASQRLGIGIASPTAQVHAVGASDQSQMLLKGFAGQSAAYARIVTSADATVWTVTAAGRVGVGVTSPSQALEVTGTILASGDLRLGSDRMVYTGGATENQLFGRQTATGITSGVRNTAVGSSAGLSLTSGSENTYVGRAAGSLNTAGSYQTFVGRGAGQSCTASQNSLFGALTGSALTTGDNNLFAGDNAGVSATTASYCTLLGGNSCTSLTTAWYTTAVGYHTMIQLTTGSGNTAVGHGAGRGVTTGVDQVIMGRKAAYYAQTGSQCVYLGAEAAWDNRGDDVIAIGYHAGSPGAWVDNADTGGLLPTAYNRCVFIGTETRTVPGCDGSVAIGYKARVDVNNAIVLGRTDVASPVVGIGTYQPTAQLHIIESADRIGVSLTGFAGQTSDYLRVLDSASAMKLQLTSTGSLGVDRLNPLAKVHIVDGTSSIMLGDAIPGSPGSLSGINFTTAAFSGTNYSVGSNGVDTFLNAPTGALRMHIAHAEFARLSSTGAFGIGSTSPGARLHVAWPSLVAGTIGAIFQGRSGQTGDLVQYQDSTAAVLRSITAAGLPKWAAASTVQTTVGAAGGASALPATPSKYLKVVGDDGATYVVPAYAAA